jgi:hypothetical protein
LNLFLDGQKIAHATPEMSSIEAWNATITLAREADAIWISFFISERITLF